MAVLGALAIEWLGSGIFIALLGALIKFTGWTWLLAGYSESTSSVPDDVVQEMAGNTILRIGIALIVFGLLATVTDLVPYLDLVVAAAILLAVARLFYRLNTWSPPQATEGR